jgi:hypothetical protein
MGPSPMRLLKTPDKPRYSVIRDRTLVLETWKHWIDRLYWEIPLENDMEEEEEEAVYLSALVESLPTRQKQETQSL